MAENVRALKIEGHPGASQIGHMRRLRDAVIADHDALDKRVAALEARLSPPPESPPPVATEADVEEEIARLVTVTDISKPNNAKWRVEAFGFVTDCGYADVAESVAVGVRKKIVSALRVLAARQSAVRETVTITDAEVEAAGAAYDEAICRSRMFNHSGMRAALAAFLSKRAGAGA